MDIIGIDPGQNGGICWIQYANTKYEKIHCYKYSNEELNNICDMCLCNSTFIYLEQVWPHPGNSASATFKFGKNVGMIEGILIANYMKYNLVSPQKWKKTMGVTKDKQSSINKAKELFPDVSLLPTLRSKKEHDGMAEALLIAEYGRRQSETDNR